MVTDNMTLTIVPQPTADAGPDVAVCEGTSYTVVNASASNYSSILWLTNAPGTLLNAGTLNPTYVPITGEVDTVTLVLYVYGNAPCGQTWSYMHINYTPKPIIEAGPDIKTCNTTPVTISSSSGQNYASLLWTTSGTGTFSDPTSLHPIYEPSESDVLSGLISLIVTATGQGNCPSMSDSLILQLIQPPLVNAGADVQFCNSTQYTVNDASAQNYSSLIWTDNGSGTLLNSGTLTPTYIPAVGESGQVILTITAIGVGSCQAVTDQKILTLGKVPSGNAGSDDVTCGNQPYFIKNASATNALGVQWTSTGTGTFNDPSQLNPIYTPSSADTAVGNVSLILEIIPYPGCTSVLDTMNLTIGSVPTASAGPNLSACPGTQFTITGASASHYSTVNWTSSGQITILNPDVLTPTCIIKAGISGQITLTMSVTGKSPCGDVTVYSELILTVNQSPVANAGPDMSIDPAMTARLSGSATGGSGLYSYSWQPSQLLLHPDSDTTTTIPLTQNTRFVLTVLDLVTGCSGTDSVEVGIGSSILAPIAVDDHDTTFMNIPVIVSFMKNDINPYGDFLSATFYDGPSHGTIKLQDDSLAVYEPETGYQGPDLVRYILFDPVKNKTSDTATIYLHVGPEVNIVIHNVITPNGDGKNDKWIITGIENYPENSVMVFNRWGDKIRSFTGYDNQSNSWDGTNWQNDPVPDGTYFYIINIDRVGKFKGWIYVRANSN
jgi:gliding motility-associated-like protein